MKRILKLKISNGQMTAIYSDALVPVLALGNFTITRASHVEPTPEGQWAADMSPVAPGVVLGPFTLRETALQAEIAYLERMIF